MNRNILTGAGMLLGALITGNAAFWTAMIYHRELPPWAYGFQVGGLIALAMLGGAATALLGFHGGTYIGHGVNERRQRHEAQTPKRLTLWTLPGEAPVTVQVFEDEASIAFRDGYTGSGKVSHHALIEAVTNPARDTTTTTEDK